MNILVIDDDTAILEAVKIVSEDLGHKILTSENYTGIRGKIDKYLPDIVFFDIFIKGKDNSSLIKRLKAHKKYKKLPIVVLSASTKIEDVASLVNANGYLAKPFDIKDFKAMIEKFAR